MKRDNRAAVWHPNYPAKEGFICPDCPVFYPTVEEFQNPFEYINSIRSVAEQSGICKVVPPKSWKPPFAMNEKRLSFRSKIQFLNTMEGQVRAESDFVEDLRMFWYKKGKPMESIPYFKNSNRRFHLNLLYKYVMGRGGYEKVNWPEVAEQYSKGITSAAELKQIFEDFLLEYSRDEVQPLSKHSIVHENTSKEELGHCDQQRPVKIQKVDRQSIKKSCELQPGSLKADTCRECRLPPPTIIIGQRFYKHFPGSGTFIGEISAAKEPVIQIGYYAMNSIPSSSSPSTASIEPLFHEELTVDILQICLANGHSCAAAKYAATGEICQYCLRGDREDQLLLCDGCEAGYHTFCLLPKLQDIPSGDWFCEFCIEDSNENQRDDTKKSDYGFQNGKRYTLMEFQQMAEQWKQKHFLNISDDIRQLEQEYWKVLKTPTYQQRLEVEYGSDLDTGAVGSGFPRMDTLAKSIRTISNRSKSKCAIPEISSSGYTSEEITQYAQDRWNLNNIPKLPESLLQYLDEDINGVIVPWMYIGMLFSTFCWHAEDHNFYSISYNHFGAPKTWYGIPGNRAADFEQVMKKLTPDLFDRQPDLHLQLVTMFSPSELQQQGIPVYRATHNPGEFMITFPSAYHAGFNNGFNCAEACNFADLNWIPWGYQSVQKYKIFQKVPIFSHESLLCTLATICTQSSSFSVSTIQMAQALKSHYHVMIQEFKHFQQTVRTLGIQTTISMEKLDSFLLESLSHWKESGNANRTSTQQELKSVKPKRKRTKSRLLQQNVVEEDNQEQSFHNTMRGKREKAGPGGRPRNSSSMKMGMRMKQSSSSPAAISGKRGSVSGLLCHICKQYCYLGAVLCLKCFHTKRIRHVVCVDHCEQLCSCDPTTDYCWASLYPEQYFQEMLHTLVERAQIHEDWEKKYQQCLALSGSQKQSQKDDRISFAELKGIYHQGKKLNVSTKKLQLLEQYIQHIQEWVMEWIQVMPRRRQQRKKMKDELLDVSRLLKLMDDSKTLKAVPSSEFSSLKELLSRIKKWQEEVHIFLSQAFQQQEKDPTTFSILSKETLPMVNCFGIKDSCENIKPTAASREEMVEVLETLLENNEIPKNVWTMEHQILIQEQKCQKWLLQAQKSLFNCSLTPLPFEIIVDMIENYPSKEMIEEPVEYVQVQALYEKGKELNQTIVERLKTCFDIQVMEELYSICCSPTLLFTTEPIRKLCEWNLQYQEWTDNSEELLRQNQSSIEAVIASYENGKSLFSFMQKPPSDLMRKLEEKLEKWLAWKHDLRVLLLTVPLPDHDTPEEILAQIHQEMKEMYESPMDFQCYCFCQQPHVDPSVFMIMCDNRSCKIKWFHPQCLGQSISEMSQCKSFYCSNCVHLCKNTSEADLKMDQEKHVTNALGDHHKAYNCTCRENREVLALSSSNELDGIQNKKNPKHKTKQEMKSYFSMIECNFCQEWYHLDCAGIIPKDLSKFEVYRCQRCCIAQKTPYYHSRPLISKARPSIDQLQSLLDQMPDSVSQSVVEKLNQVVDYAAHMFSRCYQQLQEQKHAPLEKWESMLPYILSWWHHSQLSIYFGQQEVEFQIQYWKALVECYLQYQAQDSNVCGNSLKRCRAFIQDAIHLQIEPSLRHEPLYQEIMKRIRSMG